MAEIRPFNGILFNTKQVSASDVLAPPYDVISDVEVENLKQKSPYNAVHLIRPEGSGDNKYTNAAHLFSTWRKESILVQNKEPCFYRYNQIFSIEGQDKPITRRGFIAAVRLHPFDEKVILPHERTLRGPKIDRFKLMTATSAHFSQIFGFYSDPKEFLNDVFSSIENQPPCIDGITDDGTRHVLWAVSDASVVTKIQEALKDLSIYIADGHHRYETMLALKEQQNDDCDAPSNFGTFFLVNKDDPGLIVLPIHRLIHSISDFNSKEFVSFLQEFFTMKTIVDGVKDSHQTTELLKQEGNKQPTIGMVFPHDDDLVLLSPKENVVRSSLPHNKVLADLDVTLLHNIILEKLLGIDKIALEEQRHVFYVKSTTQALEKINDNTSQVGFLLNPTKTKQICDVADSDECMPQKATFYFPKIASGIVFRSFTSTTSQEDHLSDQDIV